MTDTDLIQPDHGQNAHSIYLASVDTLDDVRQHLSDRQREMLDAQRFEGRAGQTAILPADGKDDAGWRALAGVADPGNLTRWCLAKLAETLPAGTYRLAQGEPGTAVHGWQLAQDHFTRYKKAEHEAGPRILLTGDAGAIGPGQAEAAAVARVRRLVNTPAEDMGPAAIQDEIGKLAQAHGAQLSVTTGDQLEREFPMVHAVGRAAAHHHAPRLMHLTWGSEDHPTLALVGKGVTFDSGGLDIKGASGMLLMKKDMGGSAHAIALAALVMGAGLKVRLHLIVPSVENAVSGNAFRPGDVLKSRKGLTVEIGNTDAEGRLILGDALALASEQSPDLVIDFATLTGAARVALGPEFPAMMARRDETAQALLDAGVETGDEVWRLPLPDAYREYLQSDIADTGNASGNSFAGAIVAGLFLDKFVGEDIDWAHFDTYAWRPSAKPGRPKGGDAYGLLASWAMLQTRYGPAEG